MQILGIFAYCRVCLFCVCVCVYLCLHTQKKGKGRGGKINQNYDFRAAFAPKSRHCEQTRFGLSPKLSRTTTQTHAIKDKRKKSYDDDYDDGLQGWPMVSKGIEREKEKGKKKNPPKPKEGQRDLSLPWYLLRRQCSRATLNLIDTSLGGRAATFDRASHYASSPYPPYLLLRVPKYMVCTFGDTHLREGKG